MQGSARDLGAVRGHMQLAQPDLDFLMSKSNQDRTADGLQVMGHRLAQEVVHYLQVGGGALSVITAQAMLDLYKYVVTQVLPNL